MPENVASALVMDARVGEGAGLAASAGTRLVPRPADGRRGASRIDPETVLDTLGEAGAGALVLARPPWADPGAAALPALATLLGRDVIWLAADEGPAWWAAALIASWSPDVVRSDLVRRAQVAAGLAALPGCRLPRRPWGPHGHTVPAVSPAVLGRWCSRAWRPCSWCRGGGGAPTGRCARCGHVARGPG